MISKEAFLHQQVCDYLRYRYPDVIFRTDFAAGIKMTIGQAARHKRLQKGRAWPDLFIAEPKGDDCGLFIELKAANIFKKDGSLLANEHVFEQDEMLKTLRLKGYQAEFAIGFEEAKAIIEEYLK